MRKKIKAIIPMKRWLVRLHSFPYEPQYSKNKNRHQKSPIADTAKSSGHIFRSLGIDL
jgi:hypothetical protein